MSLLLLKFPFLKAQYVKQYNINTYFKKIKIAQPFPAGPTAPVIQIPINNSNKTWNHHLRHSGYNLQHHSICQSDGPTISRQDYDLKFTALVWYSDKWELILFGTIHTFNKIQMLWFNDFVGSTKMGMSLILCTIKYYKTSL